MKSNSLLNLKIVKNMALVALLIQITDMANPNWVWSGSGSGSDGDDEFAASTSGRAPSIAPEHIAKFLNGTLPEATQWDVIRTKVTEQNPRKEDITNIIVKSQGDGRYRVTYMVKGNATSQEAIIVSKTKKLQGQKNLQKQGKPQGQKNPQGNKHHQ